MDRKRTEFFKKAEAGCEDWSTDENRELLRYVPFYSTIATQNIVCILSCCFWLLCHFRAMMMTACDLSAITKPWPVQRRVRDLNTCLLIYFYASTLCRRHCESKES